jgi:hypothetical protein
MGYLIDLSLIHEARSLLEKLLARRGLAYFLASDGQRLFSIEPDRVDLVVRAAEAQFAKSGRRVHPKAVEQSRREVRRILVRRVTEAAMRDR